MKMTGAPVTGGQEVLGEDRTRRRVARTVLENGPSTAAHLAEQLGLTPAAVRRHLDALLEEGLVEARAEPARGPRGRGRPARRFALTDSGRGVFHQAYDDLAAGALRFLAAQAGPDAVRSFARARVAELEHRYAGRLGTEGATTGGTEVDDELPRRRVETLAEALSGDGYAATTRTIPGTEGVQLCQHHCPVAHVAAEFPQLCEAETEVFARLLGTHVTRLATIAHGDGVCTTHVPLAGGQSGRPDVPHDPLAPTSRRTPA